MSLNNCLCLKDLCDKIINIKGKLTSDSFVKLFSEKQTVEKYELEDFIETEFEFKSF